MISNSTATFGIRIVVLLCLLTSTTVRVSRNRLIAALEKSVTNVISAGSSRPARPITWLDELHKQFIAPES